MKYCTTKGVLLAAALCTSITTIMYCKFGLNFDGHNSVFWQSPKGQFATSWTLNEDKWNITMATLGEVVMGSCSLRKTARNDTFLGQRFNFSVPVFQWAGSFQKDTWLRLKNLSFPYGWGKLKLAELRSYLSQLCDPSCGRLVEHRSADQCVRCAVVGNGGILMGSGQGSAIDGHDYVFRVNGAITKGFEKDVGMRTSFYVFTTNTMKHSLISYRQNGFAQVPQGEEIRYIFVPSDKRDYVMLAAAIQGKKVQSGMDEGDWPSKYFGPKSSAEKFKMLHPDFISYVVQRFLKSPLLNMKYSSLYMPSTGALMLMTALHTCDQVSAYGFITKNYDDFSDHYFDAYRKPLHFYANHDMRMESILWEAMDHRGVMTLYKRTVRNSEGQLGNYVL